jgi:hypothetical protein
VTVIRFPFIVFIPWNWLDEDNGTGGFLAFFPEPRFVLRHGHDDGLGHQLEAELLPGQNLIGGPSAVMHASPIAIKPPPLNLTGNLNPRDFLHGTVAALPLSHRSRR